MVKKRESLLEDPAADKVKCPFAADENNLTSGAPSTFGGFPDQAFVYYLDTVDGHNGVFVVI